MRFRRRLAVIAAAAILGSGLPLLLKPDAVLAHGAMTYPATRTYACYLDGRAGGGGDLNPTNPACAAAVAQGGKQPLWDFFAVLISNAAGRHREIIPDGTLCGAGTTKYAAYNAASADWPTTNLQSGAAITFRYNAWAPHPGTWYQYVTRDGWNPNAPLKWSDLDATPFDQITNPPLGSGASGAEYVWNARLPNKSGRHIIYSIWQRSDSPEAFYNCSDVNFGGNGGPTTPPPTTAPPTPPPTTAPPTTPPAGGGACAGSVRVDSSWSGGYQATVTVRNNGTAAVNPWTASWTMPSGNTISQGWNATVSQSGSTATATAPSWGASLAPGASVTIGFISSGSSSPPPSGFKLNGATCTA
ncbi:lytic polysaccharide monooxygenase [Micromonospora sp. NPDC049523]|uniref:lytic polysaccharide monooxygenase n=1 Tax=Micromonospora sp. NPDC049523 TaxID=3155921 RepID=UPI003417302D